MKAVVENGDMSRDARLAAHSAVSTALARCSDLELRDLVEAAEPVGSGIGGATALLEVGGTPVFVKRVPLTDLERQPENLGPRRTCSAFLPSPISVSGSSGGRASGPGGSWPCTP
ncbi:MAG TPA: hypothetical protein VGL64_10940 [Amycolatopsis sp.]